MTNQTTDEAAVCPECAGKRKWACSICSGSVEFMCGKLRYHAEGVDFWGDCKIEPHTLKTAAEIIESQAAQLTAATRRADDLATALKATAQAAASSATKAEQAERMLIERDGSILMLKAFFHDCNGALVKAVRALTEIANFKPTYHRKPKSFQTPLIAQQALDDMASIDIRSAASGEQG